MGKILKCNKRMFFNSIIENGDNNNKNVIDYSRDNR